MRAFSRKYRSRGARLVIAIAFGAACPCAAWGCELIVPDDIHPQANPNGGKDGFCASQSAYAICDDFDESTAVDSAWQRVLTDAGSATVAVDVNASASSPNSLRCATQTFGGSTYAEAAIQQTLSGTPSKLSLTFDLELDSVNDLDAEAGSAYAEMDLLAIDQSGGDPYRVFVEMGSELGSTFRLCQSDACDTNATLDIPIDGFMPVDVEVDLTQRTVTASINGKSFSNGLTIPNQVTPGTASVSFGLGFVLGPSPAWIVHVDNVLVLALQ